MRMTKWAFLLFVTQSAFVRGMSSAFSSPGNVLGVFQSGECPRRFPVRGMSSAFSSPGNVLGVFQSGESPRRFLSEDNCPPACPSNLFGRERHVGQTTRIWFFPARPTKAFASPTHSGEDEEKTKTNQVLVY